MKRAGGKDILTKMYLKSLKIFCMEIMLSWIQSDISSNLVIILYHCIFLLLKVLDTETFSSWHLCPMIIPHPIFKSFCLRLISSVLYHSSRTSHLLKSSGSFWWLGCGQSHYYWGVPSSRPFNGQNQKIHTYMYTLHFHRLVFVCVCITIPNIFFYYLEIMSSHAILNH